MQKTSSRTPLPVLLAALFLSAAVFGGLGYVFGRNRMSGQSAPVPMDVPSVSVIPSGTPGYFPDGSPPESVTPTVAVSAFGPDNPYGISFSYPQSMRIHLPGGNSDSSVPGTDFFGGNAIPIVTVAYPSGSYPGTNLAAASVTVSIDPAIKTEAGCDRFVTGSGVQTAAKPYDGNTKTVFRTGTVTEAAAGTRYETTVFRTLAAQGCIGLARTVAVSSIGNYPEGTVTEAPVGEISALLDTIPSTFRVR